VLEHAAVSAMTGVCVSVLGGTLMMRVASEAIHNRIR